MAIDMAFSSHKQLIMLLVALLSSCSQPPVEQTTTQHDNRYPATAIRTQAHDGIIRISAVGDIMLGGTSEPVLQEMGYDYPFEKVKHLFNNSDIVIGNLEGPLTNHETPYADKQYLFRTPPELVAPALKHAGINMLNLANNHIMDYGVQGMLDTQKTLTLHNINSVGAGMNLNQARAGRILTAENHKIGFLSYSLTFPKSFWATEDTPGTAFGHEHQIRQDIQRMKQAADIVVVSFHWGTEKSSELRKYQPLLAHAAIDEGAAAVIGHHPHVLQAVEHYKQGIILYSLGNFTFGSYSRNAEFSVIATITFRNNQYDTLELTPINVLNVDVNFQPQLMNAEEADGVIQHLNQLSYEQNTQLDNLDGAAFLKNPSSLSGSLSKAH